MKIQLTLQLNPLQFEALCETQKMMRERAGQFVTMEEAMETPTTTHHEPDRQKGIQTLGNGESIGQRKGGINAAGPGSNEGARPANRGKFFPCWN